MAQTKEPVAGVIDFERIYENLDVKDKDNEHSLVNLAPSIFIESIMVIPNDMFDMSEAELEIIAQPDMTLEKLRTLFWVEYGRAVRTKSKMNLQNICGGVCTPQYLRKSILSQSKKALYIITPRPDYHNELEDLLFIFTKKLRQIAALPIMDSNNKPDYKVIDRTLQAWESIASKRRTQPSKKMLIETKNQHLHSATHLPPSREVDAIDAQLAQLETTSNPLPFTELPEVNYVALEKEEGRD